ncbi:MAG: WS/DGAT/MGAT family O-acyltransferase [Nevskiales bacterium]
MTTRPVNPQDASFLFMETRETPMHVAGLMTFALPDRAPPDFCHRLMQEFRDSREFYSPWNRRLASPWVKSPVNAWVEDNDLDVEHHVRHSALPHPGGERELGQLVARLHSHPLDFTRPLWEFHLIEGLEGKRFAVYIKMHHSLIDGISGIRLLQRSMSTDPAELDKPPFWSVPPPERGTQGRPPAASGANIRSLLGDVGRAVRGLIKAARDPNDALIAPFQAPASVLNRRIKGQRRFATQQFSLERLKTLAKSLECTLNDIVLAICSAALRRFLKEANALPARSLTAGVPMSLRSKDDPDDAETGTAIAFIVATLGTDIADPRKRLAAICASTRRAKEQVQGLSRKAMETYGLLVMAPYVVQMMAGLGGRMRPVFNLVVSNVPGPSHSLYLRGARMEASYPVSIPSHGSAMNITCQSYAGTLNFGFTGCRDTLPHMQRIAVYAAEALEELESVVSQRRKSKKA